jgi:CHAT domain-containing protein
LRALGIRERLLGADHPDVATSLDALASLATAQHRYDLADQRYRRAIDILSRRLGADHPRTLAALVNRAGLLVVRREVAAAADIFKRAIALEEREGGPDNPQLKQPLDELADVYAVEGRHDFAEPLRRRALALQEKTVGPDDPDTATELVNVATEVAAQGRTEEALSLARRASAALIGRAAHAAEEHAIASTAQQHVYSYVFLKHVELAAARQAELDKPDQRLVDEAFASGQMAQGIDTARAINRMAARFVVGDGALAVEVRQRQDLADRRQQLDREIYRRVGRPEAAAELPRLRQALQQADTDLGRLDGEIAQTFPAYAELVANRPVAIAEVQSLLQPGEALLSLAVDGIATYRWVVTKTSADFRALPIGAAELAAIIAKLRRSLDLSRSSDLAAARFDLLLAHELYRRLLGDVARELAGMAHLIFVTDGPLQSLPPAVLVTSEPAAGSDYRAVSWLVDRSALSVLPSVQTLVSLRRLPRGEPPARAFLGIGDPLLAGASGGAAPGGLVDRLPPLPETAEELRRIAATLGGSPDDILLGERATKRRVEAMDLARFRVIAIATHGLMAGDLPGLSEPALVLTPHRGGSDADDGLLTTGEITHLRINADLVILSACNTAAPSGQPGAEGFSGLAKAFFYAGSRGLLVSHWPVASDAAVRLTTGTVAEMAAAPIGPAEALRRACARSATTGARNTTRIRASGHPSSWSVRMRRAERISA